jgi:hypothetical protein
MAKYDDFVTLARPGLLQVPDRVIDNALRRSAREFFRQTQCWREVLDPVRAQGGVNEYDLGPPDGAYVEKILWMKYGDSAVAIERPVDLTAANAAVGPVTHATLNPVAQTFITWPTPRDVDTNNFTFQCVLIPTRKSTTIPDQLADEWEVAIVTGAQRELFATPGMPWLNAAKAMEAGSVFDAFVSAAKRKQMSGGHTQLRVQPRRFV